MSIWKITISSETSGYYVDYHGVAKKATIAAEKALILAQKESKEDKNFNDELYVSEISFVACKEF